jgi:hypothetical protein
MTFFSYSLLVAHTAVFVLWFAARRLVLATAAAAAMVTTLDRGGRIARHGEVLLFVCFFVMFPET